MKKMMILLCLLCASDVSTAFAAEKNVHTATLDFTLNYRTDAAVPRNEHIMKNTVLLENKWVVAGKLQSVKDNQSLLFLVRMISHKNNKYNLQFMLVDSDEKHTYITEPRLAAITGLPAKLNQQADGKSFELNALVKLGTANPKLAS